jgi:hypothetical protein
MARSPGERTGRPAPEAGRSDVAVDVELTIAFVAKRSPTRASADNCVVAVAQVADGRRRRRKQKSACGSGWRLGVAEGHLRLALRRLLDRRGRRARLNGSGHETIGTETGAMLQRACAAAERRSLG